MATEESKATAVPEEVLVENQVSQVHADDEQEASAKPEEITVTKEGTDVQAEPAAPTEDREEAKPTEQAAVEEAPVADPKTPAKASASRRREKSTPKLPDLAAMASKIKRLKDEAGEIHAAIATNRKNIEALEAKEGVLTSEAQAKLQAAHKVSLEYTRKKCEVAIAKLDGDVPKKPLTTWMMFSRDHTFPNTAAHEQSKKRAEMWAKLPEEEMKKYTDRYEAELKRYREWGASEEGQKNHSERAELIRQIKAAGLEELDKALGSAASCVSPAKRLAMTSQDTPVKHRRVTPTEPVLDVEVLGEAGKADLVAQLKNLASRPEVVALGKSPQELLEALKASSGIVNAAKRALVGA